MKIIFRILKWLFAFVMVGILGLVICLFLLNADLPEGKQGAEADALAEKMLAAVNNEAWQKTNFIKWSFRGGHDYVWDRENNLVEVQWGRNRVILDLDNWDQNQAYEKGKVAKGESKNKLVDKAWSFFCNDSFWVIAPTKVMEDVVERRLVIADDGEEQLLVTYKSGGTTPGDSYLWDLDENGLPESYRMWVSIIPVGGVKATWEDWQTTETGLKVATKHQLGPLNVAISNLKTANTLAELGLNRNPFK